MEKIFKFICCCILLCGCQKKVDNIPELSDYYLSLTKSSEKGNKVYFQNVSFDFENMNTIESKNIERDSQYPLLVFDKENNKYLYSAKTEEGDDHLYIYDVGEENETHIDLDIWGINYILIRENDYIIVAVKNETEVLSLFSIDKETYSFKEIEIPKDIHEDMSVWQVAYIPQNDGLILQTYSIEEEYKIRDEWNSQEHDYTEDMKVPYYHYLLTDEGFEFLFELKMPQSDGILSNGKDVLVEVFYENDNEKHVIRYNIENESMEKEKYAKSLKLGFYLDNEGRYVYAIGNNIHKYDTFTGKDEILNIEFPYEGFNSNYVLVNKSK